jgi:mRNA interferase MazF
VKPIHQPQRGDLVWLDFTSPAGHEQTGRRPALILSQDGYNRKTGLAIACPITSQAKGYPFEVALPASVPASGVILADQIRCIDWRARRSELIGGADQQTLDDVTAKLAALLGL